MIDDVFRPPLPIPVRRDKNIKLGDSLLLFSRALTAVTQRVLKFSDELQPYHTIQGQTACS